MDDFCTGYSSIAMLQTLTMDTMKTDRSILLAAERDPRAAAILESVIQLGRSLGMHVLTEGIETPAQEALLRRLGCTYGQGYFYAKPMPQEDFERFREDVGNLLSGNVTLLFSTDPVVCADLAYPMDGSYTEQAVENILSDLDAQALRLYPADAKGA